MQQGVYYSKNNLYKEECMMMYIILQVCVYHNVGLVFS